MGFFCASYTSLMDPGAPLQFDAIPVPSPPGGPLAVELVPAPDPWDVARRLAHLPHLLFLDSAEKHDDRGRYSYVAADPAWFRLPASGSHGDDPFGRERPLLKSSRRSVDSWIATISGGNCRSLRVRTWHMRSRNYLSLAGTTSHIPISGSDFTTGSSVSTTSRNVLGSSTLMNGPLATELHRSCRAYFSASARGSLLPHLD